MLSYQWWEGRESKAVIAMHVSAEKKNQRQSHFSLPGGGRPLERMAVAEGQGVGRRIGKHCFNTVNLGFQDKGE